MAKPLTASKSSQRSFRERILLSCDCAMHCGEEEDGGVKRRCAVCERPETLSLMSQTWFFAKSRGHGRFRICATGLLMWFPTIFYLFCYLSLSAVDLSSGFSLCAFFLSHESSIEPQSVNQYSFEMFYGRM